MSAPLVPSTKAGKDAIISRIEAWHASTLAALNAIATAPGVTPIPCYIDGYNIVGRWKDGERPSRKWRAAMAFKVGERGAFSVESDLAGSVSMVRCAVQFNSFEGPESNLWPKDREKGWTHEEIVFAFQTEFPAWLHRHATSHDERAKAILDILASMEAKP